VDFIALGKLVTETLGAGPKPTKQRRDKAEA